MANNKNGKKYQPRNGQEGAAGTMSPKTKFTVDTRKLKPGQVPLPDSPWNSFITLKTCLKKAEAQSESRMGDLTQGAFQGTRARAQNSSDQSSVTPSTVSTPGILTSAVANSRARIATPKPKSSAVTPATKQKSALKRAQNGGSTGKRQAKRVRIQDSYDRATDSTSFDVIRPSSPSSSQPPDDAPSAEMSSKPKLKLSFSQRPEVPSPANPIPTSAVRTPSIKLNFAKGTASIAATPTNAPAPPVAKKAKLTKGNTPSSANKRKRSVELESEDELAAKKRPSPVRKLTLKTKPAAPIRAPTLTLKAKGKIPKRPLGVGYDSELEDREIDPVILDGFILRMQPGPDCDYIQKHINENTIGIHRGQGGADIQMKMFDVHGRRGVMTVRKQMYAVAMVDMPCIVEGMKSWDRKCWIKSIDICQMLLVLGKCTKEEEAKNFALPKEVDPKTMQYAHGLTPPMRWVRKRRFALTKRARLDDIEAVERRVNALLAADEEAVEQVDYEVFDHDPRLDDSMDGASETEEEQYSASEEDGDEDAEGEDEDMEAPDNYFARQLGEHGSVVDTPVYQESPVVAEYADDEIADFEADLMADDDDEEQQSALDGLAHLQAPDGGSSFAVTSTSASPSADATGAARTPASGVDGAPSPDDEGDDEEEEESDADDDEESVEEDEDAKEQDEAFQEAKSNIADMEAKIADLVQKRESISGNVLRAKMKKQIDALEGEVDVQKRRWGL